MFEFSGAAICRSYFEFSGAAICRSYLARFRQIASRSIAKGYDDKNGFVGVSCVLSRTRERATRTRERTRAGKHTGNSDKGQTKTIST